MINKNYKDSVFTLLFSEKENLIELYNAIENTNYTMDVEIEINTLENALFMDRKNDISFVIDNKLVVLIEHQSTMNYNMPIRFFMYMARLYEKMLDDKLIYKESMIKLPTPEFIVLYNGDKEQPKRQTLKMSDAFIESGRVDAEIKVNMININYGKSDITPKSKTLNGYSYFMYKIKEYRKNGYTKEEAITMAINDCINQKILENFLKRNGSEVRNMLFTEFKLDVAKEVWQEEARWEGIQEGRQEERQNIIKQLRQMGIPEEKIQLLSQL